jgi:N-acyl-D-aspartate/D-glutamate deacylase
MRRAALFLLLAVGCSAPSASPTAFDLVLRGGRVIDPESGCDATADVGISAGVIRKIGRDLEGREVLDVRGRIVSPGFIDLHSHGQDEENDRLKAMDGVTAAFELEVGTHDVDGWYAARAGKALIHHGVAVGHIPVRMAVMGEPVTFLPALESRAALEPATRELLMEIRRRIAEGLEQGAVAVGLGLQYTPAVSRDELHEVFAAAAERKASCHVHLRHYGTRGPGCRAALEETIGAAEATGAALHVVHLNSTALGATEDALRQIAEARARGVDVTTEAYPYTAGMTDIRSGVFAPGWQEGYGISFGDLQWAETGERLTAASFGEKRKTGGMVICHVIPPEIVRLVLASPLAMVASDGQLKNGKGHPRSAGCFSRFLGRYVRDEKLMDWPEALRRITLLPARRLEAAAPAMKRKGRLQPGADADLTVFDPARILDRAGYDRPALPPEGIEWVIVGGTIVVRSGSLVEDTRPGRGIRGASP